MRTVTNRYVWHSGESCEDDSDCGGDCINDRCVQTCEDKTDCTSGDQCLNKICQPKCSPQNECPTEDFSCKRKEDCESKEEHSAICRNDLCHYIKTGCYDDNHCPEGKKWTVGLEETCVKQRVGFKKFSSSFYAMLSHTQLICACLELHSFCIITSQDFFAIDQGPKLVVQEENSKFWVTWPRIAQFVYFLREMCLFFNFWMIKFTIMFFFDIHAWNFSTKVLLTCGGP